MSLFLNPIDFWLIATRLTGIVIVAPGLNEVSIPRTFKALFIIWLTYLTYTILPSSKLVINGWTDLMPMVMAELLFGMGTGFVLRVIVSSIQIAGTIVDSELGLLSAQQLNPFVPFSGGIIGRLFMLIAIAYFWIADLFTITIGAWIRSFDIIPMGSMNAGLNGVEFLIKISGGMIGSGLIIAAPIVGVTFFVTVGLGFMAKAVQGVNIFFESFLIRMIIGGLGLLLFFPLMLKMISWEFEKALPWMTEFFRINAP